MFIIEIFVFEGFELLKDLCHSGPCLNGGDCIFIGGDPAAYSCSCKDGFTGTNCEGPFTFKLT